jgi:selenoprotein W-related protein
VADEIMSNYQHLIESFTLITGSKGVFHFIVDGQTLFSKKEIGRHAEPGEVLGLFHELIGPDVEPYPQEL